ncbi:MAG: MaoC family dehydratase [Gammaproteobacteria bacterium]
MLFHELPDNSEIKWNIEVTEDLINNFAQAIDDYNPIHISHEKAIEAGFKTRIFHGAGLLGVISSAVANKLPGPGSILLKLDLKYIAPAFLGDKLTCSILVKKKYKINNTVSLSCSITNNAFKKILTGNLTVLVPN